MRRVEVAHYTPEQVERHVADALALVARLDPPADLRAAVFTQAAALLAAKNIQIEAPAPIGYGGGLAIPRQ